MRFGLGSLLDDGYNGFTDALLSILDFIPKLLYFLCASIMQVIDLCQSLFRKLVGLDTYYIKGDSTGQTGDIIFSILKNTILGEGSYKSMNTAFWSLILLGLILLFVTTIAGILRNEYTPDKEKLNSKTGVVKNAMKALASLVLIPITCFFCLYLGNAVIVAVDAASQPGTSASVVINEKVEGFTTHKPKEGESGKESMMAFDLWGTTFPTSYTPISGIIFRASCYNANRVRNDSEFYSKVIMIETEVPDGYTTNFNAFNHAVDQTECAEMIDEAFELNVKVADPKSMYNSFDYDITAGDSGIWNTYGTKITNMTKFNVGLVSYYYNLWEFDFIVAFAFAIMIGKLFLEITLGLIQRLIEIMALLFFLPIVLSFMPIDNGAGFGKWRAHFITKALSAYVTIISINIFFIIFPLLRSFRFFGEGIGLSAVNNMLSAIMMLAGMLSIKTINSMFATMFTIDKISANVMDAGAKAMSDTTDLAVKGIKATTGLSKLALAPVAGAVKHGFAKGQAYFANKKEEKRQDKRRQAVEKAENKHIENNAANWNTMNDVQKAEYKADYEIYKNDEQQFKADYLEREIRNAHGGWSDAQVQAEVTNQMNSFNSNPNSNAGLRDRLNEFKNTKDAGERAGQKFDRNYEAKEKGKEGAKDAVAGALKTPLGFLGDLIDWQGIKKRNEIK